MSTASEGLRLAVGTFTRIPSGEVSITPATARLALLLAPLAVLPLALVVALLCLTVEGGAPPLVAAGAGVAALAYGSRGMHLDGLADVVDGLAAGWDRERALAVLRSGDIGPMGVVALVLVVVLQAGAVASLVSLGWPGAVLVAAAVIASRASCAVVCSSGQVAAPGSRLGAAFVGVVPRPLAGLLLALVISLLAGFSLIAAGSLISAVVAGLAVLGGAVSSVLLRDRAARTFGGVNGDAIGAGIEVNLTVTLIILTVAW